MIIYVVGVPAAGKTTIIKRSINYIKRKFEIVNVGDIMEEFLKEKINDRDEIRKSLSSKETEELQLEVFKYIRNNYKDKDIILDTHFIIRTSNGYKSGVLKDLCDILKPDVIIMIYSDPVDILKRRNMDKTRNRDIEDIKNIELQQNLTLYFSLNMMFYYGSLLKIILNKEGHLDDSIKEFSDYINNL